MSLRDLLTDAIASEDRREWLSPDEVDEIVDDILSALDPVYVHRVHSNHDDKAKPRR